MITNPPTKLDFYGIDVAALTRSRRISTSSSDITRLISSNDSMRLKIFAILVLFIYH